MQKTGLDRKSFLLGTLAGALIVATVAAALFFFRIPGGVPADHANAVATAHITPTSPDNTPKVPVEGTWFNVKYPGGPCAIVSTPIGLIVADQRGAVSRLEYDPAGVVIATD